MARGLPTAKPVLQRFRTTRFMRVTPKVFPVSLTMKTSRWKSCTSETGFCNCFQWERTLREFWLDGRDLPSGETLEDLGPAWYGHSVGEWQGDELVVYTVGLDDRAWADQSGAYPLSLHARVEERIKRIDADTLEVQLTISDPTFYAVPWTEIGPKTFTREPPESYTYSGWKGLFSGLTEAICAPMNEVDSFNRTVRDPAIFGSETSPGQ